MSFFLPSEMGRLIYGYLRTSGSEQLAEEFLNTSDSMKECRKYRHIGFDARVHDRTLTQMLNEYSLLCDLIFENCPESDRSHFGIVNKLQHLLKSRQQPAEKHLPAETIPRGIPEESDRSPAQPVTNSFTRTLSDTLNFIQEKDPTLRLQSPSKSSTLSPPENTTAATIANVEVPVASETSLEHSHPITPTRTPADEDHSFRTPSTKTPVRSGSSSSPFKNTTTFGIPRSITPLEKLTSAKPSSSLEPAKKLEENHSTPVASDVRSPRVAVSPINVPSTPEKLLPRSSPLQNLSHDVVDINDVSVTSMTLTIFSTPTTPVKSNTIRERKSSQKITTPAKRRNEDRTPERKKETPAAPSVNHGEILSERVPATNSSQKHKKLAEAKSSGTGAKNLCVENPSPALQLPKPTVKILPKVPPCLKKYSKNHSPTKNKSSIFARPPCSGPMPWDFNLRQSLVDGAESAHCCDDVSKKECKIRTKKDRDTAAVANSNSESSKRKDDKKNIVCKKKRKLEEAKRASEAKKANVTETSVQESNPRVVEKGSHSSEVVSNKNIETKKRAAVKTSDARTSKIVERLNSAVPILPTPATMANDGCDVDENDYLLRQKISEEIVLYHKDSVDVLCRFNSKI